jgi:hypothetical protein
MTGTGGPLGRDGMAFWEKMKWLHGEIERLVYAAEIVCDGEKDFNICSVISALLSAITSSSTTRCQQFRRASAGGDATNNSQYKI